jgi:hypothetical protein
VDSKNVRAVGRDVDLGYRSLASSWHGAPLTAPGRSKERFLTREKGSVLMATGTVGANAARMAPFFAATVTEPTIIG